MAVAGLILVLVGAALILLGAYISWRDWQNKLDSYPADRKQSKLSEELSGLAKLADAIKGYPLGQQLIVWGIVIVIIGGMIGGASGFVASKSC
jgi:hypothetical protein